ncbi:MAG: pyridoxal phosphate-dependent aminotransferase [Thermoleophilia bacterium]
MIILPIARKVEEFIERSSWIRRMFEEGARLKSEHGPENVFDFSLGNPNLEPPSEFNRVMAELVSDERPGLHGYMPNAGYPETRAAVARTVSVEQQTEVPAENVVMTTGAGGALNVALKALLDPGDEVLVPRPYFVEYDFYVDNHGGSLRTVPTREDFSLDITAFASALGERTKAIIINSPNNPTGRVYDAESLVRLGGLLEEFRRETGRTVYLLSDEPYRHIVYDGVQVPPVMGVYPHTIVASSYSKDLSLAGERIGYLAVHPGAEDREKLMAGLVLANRILGFVNAPALMQRAVARLQGVSVDLDLYRRNRALLYEGLIEAGYRVPRPEGAFYLFPQAPGGDDVAFVRALQDELVLAVPGSGFGGPGSFRLSYCVSTETVRGGLPILERVYRRFQGSF